MRTARFFAAVLMIQSASALAVVDVHVLAGKKSYAADSANATAATSASAAVAAVHIAPIVMLPVALGIAATYQEFRTTFNEDSNAKIKMLTAGPELMAWIPGLAVAPYVKLTATAFNSFKLDANGSETASGERETNLSHSGMQIGAGLKWSPIPVMSALAEYRQNIGTPIAKSYLLGIAAGI